LGYARDGLVNDWPERPEGRLVDTDVQRKAAGDRAAEFVKDGMVIGYGTGRGAAAALEALARRQVRVRGVPTSQKTITGLAADSSLAGGSNPGWTRRASSVALTFGGATAGAWLLRLSLVLPVACAGLVSAIRAVAARPSR